ncbi:serine/threonine-protein kinase [Saccharopolyspora sp. CA-218241]|uniref:serine/threonine-protein kinase n=1 Tax=Saccharopolyspora sp. CA-218241 TaxID=3240027 RepID=UPI003D96C6D2
MSAEGRLIAGRYRLEQRIGSGAMGVVWRAVDERLHRTVAVKLLIVQPGYTPEETEEARQRTMREGRIAARLQHQNAIVVFDTAEDEGQPVLVMEYLPSQSLATVISEHGVLPPMQVAKIGLQVAGALAAAHMAGIVHRDLKPGNILLGDNGMAKITDFGISRAIGDVAVTKSGILAGTPAYLARRWRWDAIRRPPPTCSPWVPPSTPRSRAPRRSAWTTTRSACCTGWRAVRSTNRSRPVRWAPR